MARFTDTFQEIAAGWADYKTLGTVDSSNPIHQEVTQNLPNILLHQLSDQSHIKIQGSTGLGNITAAPWIATFDTRVTGSASSGYYVVVGNGSVAGENNVSQNASEKLS